MEHSCTNYHRTSNASITNETGVMGFRKIYYESTIKKTCICTSIQLPVNNSVKFHFLRCRQRRNFNFDLESEEYQISNHFRFVTVK